MGLIDSKAHFLEIPNNDIPGHLLWVLDMYVEDTRAKFDVFNETYERLKLLTSFINSKFHFKTITTDANSGVIVKDTDTEKTIEITDLSSGEQNEIVLAFQLIFESDASTLIMIDEPEISLHVAWQNQFLRDLKQVLALTKASAIVATHSPHIIGDDWHLTNDLGRNAK